MSKSLYFFTDADSLEIQNTNPAQNTEAFGPVYNNEDVKFRITSMHKSNTSSYNPRVFAVCDGTMCVRYYDDPNDSDLISIILKPLQSITQTTGINFVPVKYIVYKGVLKNSLIEQDTPTTYKVQDSSPNNLTAHLYAIQDRINRERERIQNPPATVGSITDNPSSSLFGHDITLSSSDSIDQLFFRSPNQAFQNPMVKAGWYIGDFDQAKFGIEIVLDDARTEYSASDAQKMEVIIEAPVPSGSSQAEIVTRKIQKECILNFLDPCALYGSMFSIAVRYYNSNDTIVLDSGSGVVTSGFQEALGNDLYDEALSKFANGGITYLDVRNEFNNSFNFLDNYDDVLKLQIDSTVYDIDYYNDNIYDTWQWPIVALNNQLFTTTNSTGVSKVDISVPFIAAENPKSVGYIVQGYFTPKHESDFPKEVSGRRRFVNIQKNANEPYSEFFQIAIPNYNGQTSSQTLISSYCRIKINKQKENNASGGIVFRKKHPLDLVFLHQKHKLPYDANTSGTTFIKVYDEHNYAWSDSDGHSTSVGIAGDSNNIAYFTFARESKKRRRTVAIEVASEISNATSLLSLLLKKYPQSQLVKGSVFPGNSSGPDYVRFLHQLLGNNNLFTSGNPLFHKDCSVLVLKQSTVASFPSSTDYESYISLINEDYNHAAPGNVEYTSYDLALRKYVDDGQGNLSIENVLTNAIKVYGHGDAPSILVEEGALLESFHTAPNNSDPCSFGTAMTNAYKNDLFAFVTELKTKISIAADPNVIKPVKNLFENVFDDVTTQPNYLKSFHITGPADSVKIRIPHSFTLSGVSGTFSVGDVITAGAGTKSGIVISFVSSVLVLDVDINLQAFALSDPITNTTTTGAATITSISFKGPPNGYLDEAAFNFGMWRLNRDLRNDIDTNAPTKSAIFIALKAVLTTDGFTLDRGVTSSLTNPEAAALLEPSLPLGKANFRNDEIGSGPAQEESRKKKLYCYMGVGNYNIASLSISPAVQCGTVPASRVFSFPTTPSSASDTAIFVKIVQIINDLKAVVVGLVSAEATCLFHAFNRTLGRTDGDPESLFMGSGDGSDTIGILGNNGNNNTGLLFFSYQLKGGTGTGNHRADVLYENDTATYSSGPFHPRTGSVRTVIHLSMLGMNQGYSSSKLVLTFTDSGTGNIQTCIFEADYSNPIIRPQGTTPGYGSQTFSDVTGVYATFDEATGDLTLNKVGTDYTIAAKLTSDRVNEDYDEVQCMICIVDGPNQLDPIVIKSDKVYDSDKFVLKKDDKCSLLKQPVGDHYVNDGIDTLVNLLLSPDIAATDIIFNLTGNFIGMKKSPEDINDTTPPYEFNTEYSFEKSRPTSGTRQIEGGTLPAGEEDLQYSFGSITFNAGQIFINIDSFTSSLLSRLGCTAPNSTELAVMDNLTLYKTSPSNPNYVADAYVTTGNPCAVMSNATNIPSYNPILSGLRCYGLVDGIRSMLKKRAEVLTKTPTEINSMLAKYNAAAASSKVEANKARGIANDITETLFDRFKWNEYTNTTVYGDIDSSTICEP
ncbi:hypothetical protein BH11BAC2_BH11BAC2_20610 [soil metagenome]